MVLFHRIGGEEVVDCLDAATGKLVWHFAYPAPYQDGFGAGEGTRTSPVIAAEQVFVFGINGVAHCLDLTTGKVSWQRDLAADYDLQPTYFGHGSTPLVVGQRLIANLGGKDDVCGVALDVASGKELWRAKHPWGASYASPIPAMIHGRECVLVFAGGRSDPPNGGLLTLDAATGEVLNATPHRPDLAASVSASSPVFCPPDQVFVSEAYGAGGVLVKIAPDFTATVAWRADRFGCYWMTPIEQAGFLYGFDGQQQRLAELVCYEVATGKERWREDFAGKFQRGNLLAVDGAFLCLGESGLLAWLELSRKTARVLASTQLFHAPETWTLPALSNGRLFICQDQRASAGQAPRLICYELPRKSADAR